MPPAPSALLSASHREVAMLRLTADTPVETLWDPLLPVRVQHLPDELAAIDQLLADEQLLRPFAARWAELHPGIEPTQGRPTIPMDTYLRFMVIKYRYRWGYETLMREVSDSLHLRRFCLIPIVAEVPHESTVRKLTQRPGPELVDELTRGLFEKAVRERHFRARALRPHSTVAEAAYFGASGRGVSEEVEGSFRSKWSARFGHVEGSFRQMWHAGSEER